TRIITHNSFDRVQALERFKISKLPKVLLSPSMDRGVDLPGDQCRVVIIAKIPFGDLGDPQITKRVHASKDGNNWYIHKTIGKIIQMAGRGVRSKDDHADTYILDEQFNRVYTENRRMFPKWFRESIVR
ncbi:MAG: helicase C-terminal domain-containing protein, partial [Dehalococcoidales bacterium]|nr:helicase C-terminal domain-containing protein [Dehalococcoidales bacterium]